MEIPEFIVLQEIGIRNGRLECAKRNRCALGIRRESENKRKIIFPNFPFTLTRKIYLHQFFTDIAG